MATDPLIAEARDAASFRDPSGFLYEHRGELLRQVNRRYADEFQKLEESGLYAALVRDGLLVPHERVDLDRRATDEAFAIIKPEKIPFISYPHEWPFSALKDAALTTLKVQLYALDHGMALKDASAYNIQFHKGRPVFIDTLSFETYREGSPWVAYRQFCQHFLAPLALMAWDDPNLGRHSAMHIDGWPLELASKLLPGKTRWRPGLALHIHAHAKAQASAGSGGPAGPQRSISRQALMGLIDSLSGTVAGLNLPSSKTTWSHYYSETNYSSSAMDSKRRLVDSFLEAADPKTVWDLGANTGEFARLATQRGALTVAWDLDHACVEANYLQSREGKDPRMIPLVQDLANPSPAIGWANSERKSFAERGPVDTVMALALVHHLAIGNNVPLGDVASLFARLGRYAIVEFVPKSDSQVQRLLSSREDVFDDYTQEGFEKAFSNVFERMKVEPVPDSERTLYLWKSKRA